jgi:hypothetical protein
MKFSAKTHFARRPARTGGITTLMCCAMLLAGSGKPAAQQNQWTPQEDWVDVTRKVASLLADATPGRPRQIQVGNKLTAEDPAPQVGKHLRVEFRLDGKVHALQAPEGKTLELPARAELLKAFYGIPPAGEPPPELDNPLRPWADVTARIKSLVGEGTPNGMRQIHAGTEWAGHDPAFGLRKTLRIEFRLNDRVQIVEAKEGDFLALPARAQVLKAFYGDPSAQQSVTKPERWAEVTAEVVAFLSSDTARIHADNDLVGDDPAPNSQKRLRVEVRIGDIVQTSEVTEGQTLELPAGTHVLKACYGKPPD